MVLDCTEGSNCICTQCPSCVLPWSLVHFFHSVVNTSKNKTCYLVYTHQHWLKEKTCAMFKKNLEIFKYMKKYVDRGGIMKQLNKRSVLFFKRVASWGVGSENTATQTKCCSLLSSFIIPHLGSRGANSFIKWYLYKRAFEPAVPAFHKSWGDPERKAPHLNRDQPLILWANQFYPWGVEKKEKDVFIWKKWGTFSRLTCNLMQMY